MIDNKTQLLLLLVIVLYMVFKIIKKMIIQKKWDIVSKKKQKWFQQHCSDLKKKLENIKISPEKSKLIFLSHSYQLLELLRNRTLTSEELVNYYTKRCQEKAIPLNLITTFCYEDAIEQARSADCIYQKNLNNPNFTPGKLLGIPISIKDVYHLKGYDTTMGCAKDCFHPEEEDGLLITLMKSEGAIPFVKTAVPQQLLINETNSWCFGYGKNPHNLARSCGGSSGGEAGLIALGCSPLGYGSDGAGSVRIPCLCCGIYGFKPTYKRTTMTGHKVLYKTWNIAAVGGTLGTCVEDQQLLTNCVERNADLHERGFIDDKPPVNFDDSLVDLEMTKIKKFGYIRAFPDLPLAPSNERALSETIVRQDKAGYTVEEIEFKDLDELLSIFRMSVSITQIHRVNSLEGEKEIPEFALLNLMANSPVWLKNLIYGLMWLVGDSRFCRQFKSVFVSGLGQYWYNLVRQNKITAAFKIYCREKGIDAILIPGGPFPSMKHGASKKLALGWAYTYVLNMTDYPCGALPVTYVRKEEEHIPMTHGFGNDMIHKATVINSEGSEGLPIGIQVCCLPFEDEKTIAAMKIIERLTPKPNTPLADVKK